MMKSLRLALFALLAASLCSCQIGYLFRQGVGQWNVVWGSEPIEKVLDDPNIPQETKDKLRLIEDVAAFGEKELGLERDGNYTTFFDTHGKPVSYNIFACSKTALSPVIWKFPIVGAVPYLGFFNLEEAKSKKAELEAQGFDVHLSTVWGYSTLGWFSDPIFSSMLADDEVAIVRSILHEMTHSTVFRPGEVTFNEALADFVGNEGAFLYFERRDGVKGELVEELAHRLQDEADFEVWLTALAKELNALYESERSDAEKLSEREKVFSTAQAKLKELGDQGNETAKNLSHLVWNNAIFLAFLTYHGESDLFQQIFRQEGMNLPRTISLIKDIPSGANGLRVLKRQL